MKLKVMKLNDKAQLPYRAHRGDAGLDLYATSVTHENFNRLVVYGTGLAIEIPDGYVGLLFPRSSVCDKELILSNCVGVLDSTYRGEVMFKFRRLNMEPVMYEVGDRIGQLVIVAIDDFTPEWVDELSPTTRGKGGYGSTTKNTKTARPELAGRAMTGFI